MTAGNCRRRKKRTTEDKRNELLELACKRLREPDDDNSHVVWTWVNELKQMEPQQQVMAKKAINDILFEGRMGTLNRYSSQMHAYPQLYAQPRFVHPESTPSSRSSTPMTPFSHGSFQSNPVTYDNFGPNQDKPLAECYSNFNP